MTDPSGSADAHAYVDNCLDADSRRAFEAKLSEDQALRRRVEFWQEQNEAIRAAYGAPTLSALPLGRSAHEGASSWMPSQISSRRLALAARERASGAEPSGSTGAERRFRPRARAPASPSLRIGLVLALSLGALILSASGGPADPRGALSQAGLSAFRAFGVDSTAGFDFSTNDPRALAKWLSPRYWPAAPEAASLEIAGWTPVGVRIVPGSASAAAFIVWENADAMRAGLLVEPLDAPAPYSPKLRDAGGFVTSAWTAGGRGFSVVAPDPKDLEALTRLSGDPGAL